MILIRDVSITRAIGRGGPWNRDFLGPEFATSETSAIWGPKVSAYRPIGEGRLLANEVRTSNEVYNFF